MKPDRHAQHEFLCIDTDTCPDGCVMGFEGDLQCERAVFSTLYSAQQARVAAQVAVLQLKMLLNWKVA